MKNAFKVTGHTLFEQSVLPSEHTDYELAVAFERWEDNRETVENFVAWYWSIDLKANPQESWRVLTDTTCARALAVFHFRSQHTLFHDNTVTYISSVPAEQPTVETNAFRLWITKQTRKDVFTSVNAGWELYCQCEHRKISVDDAKRLLREKFPSQRFFWSDVMRAFSKQGGRYTEKYLRRA